GAVYAHANLTLTGGKSWVSFDPEVGSGSSGIGVPTGTDTVQYLAMLPGATGPVQVVGAGRIDGAMTTHYRVAIDVRKAYAALPAKLRTVGPDLMAQLGATTMPYDIWLDDQHVVRQIEFRVSVGGVTADARVRIRGSQNPVHVTAPSRSDV